MKEGPQAQFRPGVCPSDRLLVAGSAFGSSSWHDAAFVRFPAAKSGGVLLNFIHLAS